MNRQEALARIAALCDEFQTDAHPGRLLAQVRAVLAEVTPETGVILGRDALVSVLGSFAGEAFGSGNLDYAAWADRVLALVRPVVGVTLTPEEAATAAACIRAASSIAYMRDDLAALAARLEAAS